MPISIPTSIAGISIPGAVNGPLSLLYGNKYLKDSLAFPRDLGSNPARNHVIWFDIMVPDPAKKNFVTSENLDSMGGTLSQLGGGLFDTLKGFATNGISGSFDAAGNKLRSFGSSDGVKAFGETVKNFTESKLNTIPKTSIALYIPDTVHVSYESHYSEDFSIANALGKPYYLAQGAVSLFDSFKKQGDTKVSNIINQAGNDPFIRAKAAELLGAATGTRLKELALNAGGIAMNPQLQVLFSNIGFRHFQFDFVLTPYSKEEADTIKQIIEAFKYASAPEFLKNGVFATSLFMEIPNVFKIKFLYNGAENTNVNKIGDCVLTSVNVDYAPNGWSTFNDGAPVQTRLTLQFTETVIIDKNKIREGY